MPAIKEVEDINDVINEEENRSNSAPIPIFEEKKKSEKKEGEVAENKQTERVFIEVCNPRFDSNSEKHIICIDSSEISQA